MPQFDWFQEAKRLHIDMKVRCRCTSLLTVSPDSWPYDMQILSNELQDSTWRISVQGRRRRPKDAGSSGSPKDDPSHASSAERERERQLQRAREMLKSMEGAASSESDTSTESEPDAEKTRCGDSATSDCERKAVRFGTPEMNTLKGLQSKYLRTIGEEHLPAAVIAQEPSSTQDLWMSQMRCAPVH